MANSTLPVDALAIEAVDDKIDHAHLEQGEAESDAKRTTTDAITAEEAEHTMPLLQALKVYKSAILWSMAISLVIVMDGYDTGRESLTHLHYGHQDIIPEQQYCPVLPVSRRIARSTVCQQQKVAIS